MWVSSDPLALFCHKALRDTFLSVTTYEKKTVFLLTEVFSKLFNTQNDGHQDQLRVAIYYLSGAVRI